MLGTWWGADLASSRGLWPVRSVRSRSLVYLTIKLILPPNEDHEDGEIRGVGTFVEHPRGLGNFDGVYYRLNQERDDNPRELRKYPMGLSRKSSCLKTF